jgi:hypothetical protein
MLNWKQKPLVQKVSMVWTLLREPCHGNDLHEYVQASTLYAVLCVQVLALVQREPLKQQVSQQSA